MRRFFALMTALCLIILFLPARADSVPTPTPLPGYTLHPSADDIWVYATRSRKANIVGYIRTDGSQEVHVLSVDGDW